jgi:ketosteroid isomerase-like protein
MKSSGQAAAIVSKSSSAPTAAEREIRALRAASNRGIAERDVAAVAATLAEDFVVVIGDGTLLTRAGYLEAFAHTFAQPVPLRYERMAEAVELSASLPLAAERGRWVGILPDGTVLFTGTYMAMWRRTGEGWRLRSEMFVTLG